MLSRILSCCALFLSLPCGGGVLGAARNDCCKRLLGRALTAFSVVAEGGGGCDRRNTSSFHMCATAAVKRVVAVRNCSSFAVITCVYSWNNERSCGSNAELSWDILHHSSALWSECKCDLSSVELKCKMEYRILARWEGYQFLSIAIVHVNRKLFYVEHIGNIYWYRDSGFWVTIAKCHRMECIIGANGSEIPNDRRIDEARDISGCLIDDAHVWEWPSINIDKKKRSVEFEFAW